MSAVTAAANEESSYVESKGVKETRELLSDLCRHFYTLGWVSGTGGSITIKVQDDSIPKSQQLIVMSPSGTPQTPKTMIFFLSFHQMDGSSFFFCFELDFFFFYLGQIVLCRCPKGEDGPGRHVHTFIKWFDSLRPISQTLSK